jgi:hypothetical protein
MLSTSALYRLKLFIVKFSPASSVSLQINVQFFFDAHYIVLFRIVLVIYVIHIALGALMHYR